MGNQQKQYVFGLSDNSTKRDLDIRGCRTLASMIIRSAITDYIQVVQMYRHGEATYNRLLNARGILQ